MSLSRKLATLTKELRRPEHSTADKVLIVAQRGAALLGVWPHLSITRRVIVELRQPPKAIVGLSDLTIRRATDLDITGLAALDDTNLSLVRSRLDAGDFAYIAEVDGEILAHTWFHRGPTPFDEERLTTAPWGLDDSTFWSYHGVARREARSSGVFVKLFQTALREVFEKHGAQSVQGFVEHTNGPSLSMHRRMGFVELGRVTAVALLRVKWLRWKGSGVVRHWVLPRGSDFAMTLPPRGVAWKIRVGGGDQREARRTRPSSSR